MAEEDGNLWYRKVGFYSNPFSIKPAPYDFKIFGQDAIVEELLYKVPSGTMSFIEGPFGTGKTSMLKLVIDKFKGKGKVIYFACNRIQSDLDIEELLLNRYGFWGKLFKLHPKDMVVLLDEAQDLSSENTQRIKYFFDQGNIKSVVFAGIDYEKTDFHESIKERVGQNGVLKVRSLDDDEAIQLIRNRIGESTLLTDDSIKTLWKEADKIPRRLLHLCDQVSRHAVLKDEKEVTEALLEESLGETPKEESSKEETKEEPSKEINSTKKKSTKKKTSK